MICLKCPAEIAALDVSFEVQDGNHVFGVHLMTFSID